MSCRCSVDGQQYPFVRLVIPKIVSAAARAELTTQPSPQDAVNCSHWVWSAREFAATHSSQPTVDPGLLTRNPAIIRSSFRQTFDI